MSRETLLDDAITKAKEAEDWQLVEWLRMARGGERAARWYTEKLRDANRTIRKLLNENAKLRELLRIAIEFCVNGSCAEDYECPMYESGHSCGLYTEARELGIEEDE